MNTTIVRGIISNLKLPVVMRKIPKIQYYQCKLIKNHRRPLKVTLAPQFENIQPVNEYMNENKITIKPITEDVTEVDYLEDDLDLDDQLSSKIDLKTREKRKKSKKKLKSTNNNDEEAESDNTKNLILQHLKYKRATTSHLGVIAQTKSKNLRENHNLVMMEGKHLISDALRAGLIPQKIFFTRKNLLLDLLPKGYAGYDDEVLSLSQLPLYEVKYNQLKIWSNLKTCPGLTGIFDISNGIVHNYNEDVLPVTVILDQIKDPSNMGSLLRTLACLKVKSVLLMEGCCDIWNSKVLRTSSGGMFFMNLKSNICWSQIFRHLGEDGIIYLADICRPPITSTTDLNDIQPFKRHHTSKVNSMDNYQLDELYSVLSESSEGEYLQVLDDGREVTINTTYTDPDHLQKFSQFTLQNCPYNEITYYEQGNIEEKTLIITGEDGISNCARKFCMENEGTELVIPTELQIGSLNTSTASAILIYEMQRQFMLAKSSNSTEAIP